MEERRKDAGTPPAETSYGDISAAEAPVNSRRRGGGQKRKVSSLSGGSSSTPSNHSSKRQAREKLASVPFPPIHNGPLTRARQQPNNGSSVSAAASPSGVKIEQSDVARREVDGIEEVKGEQELNEKQKVNWEDLEANIEAGIEAIRSRDDNVHVVPNHAGWFSWTTIHPLEEKSLPSFFNGKLENRTPEIYMEIRNRIMKKFHANPSIQIELNDLNEITVGDVESTQEVMEFLDYWGLINYHPFLKTDSTVTTVVDDADKAKKTESLLESLFHFESENPCVPDTPRKSVATPAAPSGLLPEPAIAEDLAKSEEPSVEYHCNSCSADCSRKRYHCQKQADFDLCPECFNNGMLGSDMSPSDFILMEPAESGGASSGKWTDQETLLLLEALELFKENWSEIAEHVATKTKAQCILHFAQMPIEDVFFDSGDEVESSSKEHADNVPITNDTEAPKASTKVTEKPTSLDDNQLSSMEKSKPEEASKSHVSKSSENLVTKALSEAFKDVGLSSSPGGPCSFADAGNPVMTLAAFLVNLVEPNIASVAARNSLKSISGSSSGDQLALRHCFCLEDPPDEKKSVHSERTDAEMTERETGKDEENTETQKSDVAVDGVSAPNEGNINSSKGPVKKQDKPSTSSDLVNNKVVHPSDKSSDASASKVPELALDKESSNASFPSKLGLGTAEGSCGLTMEVEVPPGFEREPGESTVLEKPSESNIVPNSSSQNKDLVTAVTSKSTDENVANKEQEEENGDLKSKNEGDPATNKLRNAAVTTLSALSVKAKLLAKQEEEQIRQLAALLIEKQLNKVEMKLSFLNEMESLVMRVRDQLERSKTRLFHERAQIIAARLGMSGSRPMQQPMPANRSAMSFTSSGPRPPLIGMSGQRPPVPKPAMISNPADQDQVSSVRSK